MVWNLRKTRYWSQSHRPIKSAQLCKDRRMNTQANAPAALHQSLVDGGNTTSWIRRKSICTGFFAHWFHMRRRLPAHSEKPRECFPVHQPLSIRTAFVDCLIDKTAQQFSVSPSFGWTTNDGRVARNNAVWLVWWSVWLERHKTASSDQSGVTLKRELPPTVDPSLLEVFACVSRASWNHRTNMLPSPVYTRDPSDPCMRTSDVLGFTVQIVRKTIIQPSNSRKVTSRRRLNRRRCHGNCTRRPISTRVCGTIRWSVTCYGKGHRCLW